MTGLTCQYIILKVVVRSQTGTALRYHTHFIGLLSLTRLQGPIYWNWGSIHDVNGWTWACSVLTTIDFDRQKMCVWHASRMQGLDIADVLSTRMLEVLVSNIRVHSVEKRMMISITCV